MLRRTLLLLLTTSTLACPRAEVPPLASTAASARPFVEAQLAAHQVPAALARALPLGLDTPVFALVLFDRDVVGFQFEVAAAQAAFHARGLRRLAARLSPDEPAAVWLSPSEDASRRRLSVMTVQPMPWRVLAASDVPATVDFELLEALLEGEIGPAGTLHELEPDRVSLEFDHPADEFAELVLPEDASDAQRARVEQELSQRRLTLPVP